MRSTYPAAALALAFTAATTVHADAVPDKLLEAVSNRPFGLTLGTTTCNEASKLLNGPDSKAKFADDGDGNVYLDAASPSDHFEGAFVLRVICHKPNEPVVVVAAQASKGGGGANVGQLSDALDKQFHYFDGCAKHPVDGGCEAWFAPVRKDVMFKDNVIINVDTRTGDSTYVIKWYSRWLYEKAFYNVQPGK